MSALGHKRTLKCLHPMSALPPKADIGTKPRNVRFVPIADMAFITQTPDLMNTTRHAVLVCPATILIAVQWLSMTFLVLVCRAPFLQIRRNRLLPQVEREICQSPLSSMLAGRPTSR